MPHAMKNGHKMRPKLSLVAHEDDLNNYPECEACLDSVCSDECFEKHPGSLIAMVKLLEQHGEVTTEIYKGE